jgi:hypothetical protein
MALVCAAREAGSTSSTRLPMNSLGGIQSVGWSSGVTWTNRMARSMTNMRSGSAVTSWVARSTGELPSGRRDSGVVTGCYPCFDLLGDRNGIERLDDELVCARSEATLAIRLKALGREYGDVGITKCTVAFDSTANVVAIHARHHDVEQHDRRPMVAHRLERALAVGGGDEFQPCPVEDKFQLPKNIRLVINDQDRISS